MKVSLKIIFKNRKILYRRYINVKRLKYKYCENILCVCKISQRKRERARERERERERFSSCILNKEISLC